jgi:ribosome biogenesis GTPase
LTLAEQTREAALIGLGWSSFFGDQVGTEEASLVPVRITHIHLARMSGHSTNGPVELALPGNSATGDYAVGDVCSPSHMISSYGGGSPAYRSFRGE